MTGLRNLIFLLASSVHRIGSDSFMEYFPHWFSRRFHQQAPNDRIGEEYFSKVGAYFHQKQFEGYNRIKTELYFYFINLSSRCNAEVVIGNLFKVFDPENTGELFSISFQRELFLFLKLCKFLQVNFSRDLTSKCNSYRC